MTLLTRKTFLRLLGAASLLTLSASVFAAPLKVGFVYDYFEPVIMEKQNKRDTFKL